MLDHRRLTILIALALGLWLGATAFIRLLPAALSDPIWVSASFAAMAPLGWLSVQVIGRLAGLKGPDLLAGVAVVGAVAMMIDGLVLAWRPEVYAPTQSGARLGGAWLLWGYGLSLGIALWMSRANTK
ncbi:hypothetical protein [Phenylobacterium immobile]|uniref:hypothetical protein n=1 Tax=Phenylobacterium immobile TaxID=21 RepID=UPI000B2E74C4|nr:hypothetical protein [Phenylobacterium immobile]